MVTDVANTVQTSATFINWTFGTDTISILGSAEGDVITGTTAADIIDGNTGNDIINLANGYFDVITDFAPGSVGWTAAAR